MESASITCWYYDGIAKRKICLLVALAVTAHCSTANCNVGMVMQIITVFRVEGLVIMSDDDNAVLPSFLKVLSDGSYLTSVLPYRPLMTLLPFSCSTAQNFAVIHNT